MKACLQLVSADDGRFVERLQAGEVSARGQWFDQEARRIQGLVLRLVGPRAEVTDLVQDVFLQAFRSVKTFQGGRDALAGWLTGVTVRVVRTQLKKWRVRRVMRWWSEVADEVHLVSTEGADAETALAVQRTWQVLAGFPADERLAFALRYFNQYEVTEVASALVVSLATAKRRLASAHRRFVDVARTDPVLADWAERVSHDG